LEITVGDQDVVVGPPEHRWVAEAAQRKHSTRDAERSPQSPATKPSTLSFRVHCAPFRFIRSVFHRPLPRYRAELTRQGLPGSRDVTYDTGEWWPRRASGEARTSEPLDDVCSSTLGGDTCEEVDSPDG
jgi:hypothetical protein